MRTAVLTIRAEPHYRRAAFESMLKKHDYRILALGIGKGVPNSKEDLLILWNKKRGNEEQAANAWEKAGGTVLVVENGYLQPVDKTYYAVSVHGHNGSGWFPVGTEDRFTKLGFELKPWKETGYHLVCGQRGIGSVLMASPPLWAERCAKKLEAQGLTTKLRLHPGNFAPKTPLIDDLKGAAWCHIWSSASGVLALVEGVQVRHYAPLWVCDRPANRVGQLHRMSHGQWHHEEIAAGEPLARILANLGEATWP